MSRIESDNHLFSNYSYFWISNLTVENFREKGISVTYGIGPILDLLSLPDIGFAFKEKKLYGNEINFADLNEFYSGIYVTKTIYSEIQNILDKYKINEPSLVNNLSVVITVLKYLHTLIDTVGSHNIGDFETGENLKRLSELFLSSDQQSRWQAVFHQGSTEVYTMLPKELNKLFEIVKEWYYENHLSISLTRPAGYTTLQWIRYDLAYFKKHYRYMPVRNLYYHFFFAELSKSECYQLIGKLYSIAGLFKTEEELLNSGNWENKQESHYRDSKHNDSNYYIISTYYSNMVSKYLGRAEQMIENRLKS